MRIKLVAKTDLRINNLGDLKTKQDNANSCFKLDVHQSSILKFLT